MLITSGSSRVNLWYCKTKLDTSHSKGLKGQENGTVNHFSYLTGKMNTFIEKKLATWIKLSQLQGSELWMQDTLPGLSSFQHERSTELQPKIKTWPTYQCDSNTWSWKLPPPSPHVTLYPFIIRMMKKKAGNLSVKQCQVFWWNLKGIVSLHCMLIISNFLAYLL